MLDPLELSDRVEIYDVEATTISRLPDYGPWDPILGDGELPTIYRVHLNVKTGIVVDITPLGSTGGTILTNEIYAVNECLDVRP